MKKLLLLSAFFLTICFQAQSQHVGQILEATSMSYPTWAYNGQEITVTIDVYNTSSDWVGAHFYLVIDNVNSPWYISTWDDAKFGWFAPNEMQTLQVKGRVFSADLLPPGGKYELQVRVNKNGSMAGVGEGILSYARVPFSIR
ncbi:MAG: hypothetical protein E6772_01820 [Dysgonomonas sp.]|nr:hypothetical protein [Dysgonomonas sp.]